MSPAKFKAVNKYKKSQKITYKNKFLLFYAYPVVDKNAFKTKMRSGRAKMLKT
jgi:hypothetical protein